MNVDEFLEKLRAVIDSPLFKAVDSEIVVDDGMFYYHITDIRPQGRRIVLVTEIESAPPKTHGGGGAARNALS